MELLNELSDGISIASSNRSAMSAEGVTKKTDLSPAVGVPEGTGIVKSASGVRRVGVVEPGADSPSKARNAGVTISFPSNVSSVAMHNN